MNDLWLILIGPILLAGTAGFVWLLDYFFGDCYHKWDKWTSESTEFAYVQHRACLKCGYLETTQYRKMGYENRNIQ